DKLVTGVQTCALPISAAWSGTAAALERAAHRIRDITPGARGRQWCRRAVLVDDIKERVPICHRDPGIAHPDVELALVLHIGLLREPRALGRHPPCVVGLG